MIRGIGVGSVLLAGALGCGLVSASPITSILGVNGPGYFTLFTGGASVNINAASVTSPSSTTPGNVIGIGGTGTLTLSAPDDLSNEYVQLQGNTAPSGTAGTPPLGIATGVSLVSATTNLSSIESTLATYQASPNYTYAGSALPSTLSAVNVGGINVLNITGTGAINNVVLDDSNGSQWIVNISGGNTVTTGHITTSSGSAYNTIINVDSAGAFQVQVPTAGWEGILFDSQTANLTVDGNWNGEVIDASTSASTVVTLMSAITLSHPNGAQIPSIPEPASFSLTLGAGLLAIGFARRRTRRG